MFFVILIFQMSVLIITHWIIIILLEYLSLIMRILQCWITLSPIRVDYTLNCPGEEEKRHLLPIFSNAQIGTFLIQGNNISYTSQNGIDYEGKNGIISDNTISNTSIYLGDSGGIYSATNGSN